MAQITILGGAGDDTIEATTDELQTEANFSAGVNAIDGGSGNDTILARAASGMEATDPLGRNLLDGRSGNDQIFGFAIIKGNDGGLAENVIHGGTGDDVLSGLTRTGDSVSGSTAVNRIFGGDGDDQLTGQQFGTGVDAVAVARSVTFKSLLDGGNGSDILFATGEIGGDGAPLIAIELATVENTLIGGAGNDELQAFSRSDRHRGACFRSEPAFRWVWER